MNPGAMYQSPLKTGRLGAIAGFVVSLLYPACLRDEIQNKSQLLEMVVWWQLGDCTTSHLLVQYEKGTITSGLRAQWCVCREMISPLFCLLVGGHT